MTMADILVSNAWNNRIEGSASTNTSYYSKVTIDLLSYFDDITTQVKSFSLVPLCHGTATISVESNSSGKIFLSYFETSGGTYKDGTTAIEFNNDTVKPKIVREVRPFDRIVFSVGNYSGTEVYSDPPLNLCIYMSTAAQERFYEEDFYKYFLLGVI